MRCASRPASSTARITLLRLGDGLGEPTAGLQPLHAAHAQEVLQANVAGPPAGLDAPLGDFPGLVQPAAIDQGETAQMGPAEPLAGLDPVRQLLLLLTEVDRAFPPAPVVGVLRQELVSQQSRHRIAGPLADLDAALGGCIRLVEASQVLE